MTKEEFNAKWPMTKIPDAIRKVAVVWGDAHEWFIQDKVKLAQDILEATDKLLSERVEQRSIVFAEWVSSYENLSQCKKFFDCQNTKAVYNEFLSTL